MAYRPDPRSPYAAPYRPPRWPWVFASILLVAVISATALLVSGEMRPGNREPESDLAMVQSPVAQETGTETPTPEPTLTPVPTATSVDVGAPTRIAENWVSLWESGDYSGMYDLTSDATQKTMSRDEFISRYTNIQQEAGLTKIQADVSDSAGLDGSVPIKVTFTSSLVGEIKEDNAVHLVREGDAWKVAWTPSAIFKDLGTTGCVDFVGETTDRGRILDRNGKVLAEDAEVARISVVPGQVEDPDTTYAELSKIIDMPVDDIEAKVDAAGAPNWSVPLKDLSADRSTELLNALQPYKGVQVQRATARHYPYGAVTAHLVGWVSIATQEDIENDDTGLVQPDQMLGRSGLELGANDLLTGKPGGELLIVECETRAERAVLGESDGEPPKDIILTIDVDFQKAVDAALTAQEKQDPEKKDEKMGQRSAAVVIDPQTGAVLAMVSHPTFDPNGFITGDFSDEDLKVMQDSVLRAQMNRAIRQAYPTGSIFKAITTSAAMHDLGYTADTQIDCPATFSIGDVTWADWVVENGLGAQGLLTLHQALVNSCNTVFYQIGEALDKQDEYELPDMARAFGLGESTGIPYLSDISGTIPDPDWKLETIGDGWSRGDAVNLSIGQGYMEATPLQMANAYAAIANGGTLLRPYVVDKTQVGDEKPEQVGERKEIGKIPLTAEQMSALHSMLRDQTSDPNGYGSTRVFGDFDWPISGKTGTAQIDFVERPHSWFAAYGPEGDPTIASVVLVENVGEGVSYAAPATKDIYTAYIKMEGKEP
ncbi:MAG TPA: penicillin-binding transpeptidase domain-containing protein [Thermomicrobiales bacterium]|nr:penicillin-binding transpeptidase domain-containing protein [Thermomicrobiales bacterium]